MAFIDDSNAPGPTNSTAALDCTQMDVDDVRVSPGTHGQLQKLCRRCGTWVGVSKNLSDYTLVEHWEGKRCRKLAQTRAQPLRAPESSAASASFPPNPSPPFSTSSEHPAHNFHGPSEQLLTQPATSTLDSPAMVTSPSLPPLSSLPPSPFPDQTLFTSPTTSNGTMPNSFEIPPSQSILPATFSSNVLPQRQSLSPSNSVMPPALMKIPCHGAPVKWDYGCPATTYPFHRHVADHLSWSVTTQRPPQPDTIFLRSFSCLCFRDPSTEACFECLKIPSSKEFRSLALIASKDPTPTTPWPYLSRDQLLEKLRSRTDECRQLRKGASSRKSSHLTKRLDDYERLFQHIAISDYKNVSRVLLAALKNGSSPAAVISKLQDAIDRKYNPHPGTDELALDLGCLVKAIGGNNLLFALNRGLGLPSYRTIGRHRKVPQLIPAILEPSYDNASTNISTFFNPDERPQHNLSGHSILIDGVALEERCRYLRLANSVIGLCREHARELDLHVQSTQSILSIEDAIHNDKPRAHYASEATVLAIAPFRQSGYSAVPVVLSGSCKREGGKKMSGWVADVIHAWNDHADGEATMRMCRYTLCMSHKLATTDPLYHLLQNLAGLNLFTGEGNVTMTCDPKHIIKRFATLLRAREGIVVNTSIVNKNHLRLHLIRLPHINPSSVEALVDPADKQNVPKAVTLLQSLEQLRSVDTSGCSPSQMNEYHSLVAVGEIFGSFVKPFVDVTWTLSDQLTSLSKYAHATFAVYYKHSTDFMTSALYADSQAIVKDIYFCVAKQKLLDPHANFYIIHCGTDRLETDFCLARTQNHHRNFDILDLAGKLATSSVIDSIYARNPMLDAGSRRLKVTGVVGVDHLNPRSWVGDVNVEKVSLQWCWEEGRKQASSLISSVYPGAPVVDFKAMFCFSDCDLLRPRGSCVGFSDEADRSLEDDSLGCKPVAGDDGEGGAGNDGRGDDDEYDEGGHVEDDGRSEGGYVEDDEHNEGGHVEDDGYGEDGWSDGGDGNLEDLLPDSTDAPLNNSYGEAEDWLEIGGERYPKASLISQHLKANRSKKVVERTLRVRGLTVDDLRKRPSEPPMDPNGDNVQVGDLVATLVRTEPLVCLAIIQAIGIRKDRNTRHIIKAETLYDPEEDYFVQGEVLRVVQVSTDTWAWPPRDFLTVSKPKKSGHKKSAVRDFSLSVPGFLCHRINPKVCPIPDQLRPPESPNPSLPHDSRTWMFCADELHDLLQQMWSDFRPDSDDELSNKVKQLPQVWNPDSLPYADKSGTATFTVENFRLNVPTTPEKEAMHQCLFCDARKKLKGMRDHVGHHILSKSRGVEEDRLRKSICENPCGFCGGDMCSTTLTVAGSKRQIASNCQLQCPFKYGSAKKSTRNSPCTNIPIKCAHCPETVWKYNAVNHITLKHKAICDSKKLNPEFILEIQLDEEEEEAMGIPSELVSGYRAEHPGLLLEQENRAATEAAAQATRPKKRKRC